MCLKCGHLMIFTDKKHMRQPTKEEAADLEMRPEVIEAQIVRASFIATRKNEIYQDPV